MIETEAAAPSTTRRVVVIDFAILGGLWLLAVLITGPVGEFPLNDDWSWSLTAQRLAAGEGYHPTGWTEMTLFTHALWGALFCLPAGFSFTALRLSTLVLSLGGVLALYALIRQLRGPRALALLGALTLAFNPIYFALSHTYMADVPFTTLLILAVLFFVRNLQTGGHADLLIATALTLAATLSRQMGLCLPLAFGVVVILRHGCVKREVLRAAGPLAVCVVVFLGFQLWLQTTGKAPANTLRTDRLWAGLADPLRIPVNLVYYGWAMLMYLGWFALPLMILAPSRVRNCAAQPSLAVRVMLLGFGFATAVRFLVAPSWMPVHNNVLVPQGIGPATLRDTLDLKLPHLPALPVWFWAPVTLLSLAGAILILVGLTRTALAYFPNRRFTVATENNALGLFFLLGAIIYLLPFLLSGFFDRYLLPVLALLVALITVTVDWRDGRLARPQAVLAALLIAGAGLFGVAGTRDYLEWNRTRWMVLNTALTEQKWKPEEVDGGFEYNGWHLYNQPGLATNWWHKVPHVVAFGEINGFETVSTNHYRTWLPPGEGRILVLKRLPWNY